MLSSRSSFNEASINFEPPHPPLDLLPKVPLKCKPFESSFRDKDVLMRIVDVDTIEYPPSMDRPKFLIKVHDLMR